MNEINDCSIYCQLEREKLIVPDFKYQNCECCQVELMTDSDNALPVICESCYIRKYKKESNND